MNTTGHDYTHQPDGKRKPRWDDEIALLTDDERIPVWECIGITVLALAVIGFFIYRVFS